jgi:ankyrin repeat protein
MDKFPNSEATEPRDNIYALLGISSDACDTDLLKANYEKKLEDVIFDTTSFLLNFNTFDSAIRRFFDWTLPKFFKNLRSLADEVLKCAMDAEQEMVMKLLIKHNDVHVNMIINKETLLSWAAERGHEAVVKLLLETGKVDVDSKDIFGWTPLSRAVAGRDEVVVKLLQASTT